MRVQVPQAEEWNATSAALIWMTSTVVLVEPVALAAEGPPPRLLSLIQEHPCEESEFCHKPGAISSPTSQVPDPNGSRGDAEGGSRLCDHWPHPSDQNATSEDFTSTVNDEPEPITASSETSDEFSRFH